MSYQLLDFGNARKLERFGNWVLDRPCPAAENLVPTDPQAWQQTTATYDAPRATAGKWAPAPKKWEHDTCTLQFDKQLNTTFELTPLPSGQIGIFPEQLESWHWIVKQIQNSKRPLKVLNLFAYTGGSTLAAARAGAEVTHVDAAKSMVARARTNAAHSDLADHPIRWIVEDALKFCHREVKRGNQYDAIILDPPSYGHGPKGEAWSIRKGLLPLLELCGELTASSRAFILCTCHTPEIGPAELSAYLSDGIFGHCGQPPQTGSLYLTAATNKKLPSGTFARWPK
jgi:23S rRNA (cytosine1962-C5)-methyltransferase